MLDICHAYASWPPTRACLLSCSLHLSLTQLHHTCVCFRLHISLALSLSLSSRMLFSLHVFFFFFLMYYPSLNLTLSTFSFVPFAIRFRCLNRSFIPAVSQRSHVHTFSEAKNTRSAFSACLVCACEDLDSDA